MCGKGALGSENSNLSSRFRQRAFRLIARRTSSRLDALAGEMPEDPGDDPVLENDTDDPHLATHEKAFVKWAQLGQNRATGVRGVGDGL